MLDVLNSESPSTDEVAASVNGFVQRVQRFCFRLGMDHVGLDEGRLVGAYAYARQLLGLFYAPSCFKAAGAWTMAISALRPFDAQLPDAYTPDALAMYPNAIFGVLESVYWMEDAEIKKADGNRKLDARIVFSDHFFKEFVPLCGQCHDFEHAVSSAGVSLEAKRHHAALALIFESLAYQENRGCRNGPPNSLRLDGYFSILGDN